MNSSPLENAAVRYCLAMLPPAPPQCGACALFSYVRSAILRDERFLHFQPRRDTTFGTFTFFIPPGMDICQDFEPITEAEQQRLLAGAVGVNSIFHSYQREGTKYVRRFLSRQESRVPTGNRDVLSGRPKHAAIRRQAEDPLHVSCSTNLGKSSDRRVQVFLCFRYFRLCRSQGAEKRKEINRSEILAKYQATARAGGAYYLE